MWRPSDDCPFEKGTPEWFAWMKGWNEGCKWSTNMWQDTWDKTEKFRKQIHGEEE